MAKTKERVLGAADTAKPYVDLALHDEQLRANVKAAFEAAREIYDDIVGRRGVSGFAQRVATDKDIQDNLRTAIEELRRASNRIQSKGSRHSGRNTGLLVAGIALGLLFNPVTGPQTRGWLRRRLFGGGSDEFGYSPSGNGQS